MFQLHTFSYTVCNKIYKVYFKATRNICWKLFCVSFRLIIQCIYISNVSLKTKKYILKNILFVQLLITTTIALNWSIDCICLNIYLRYHPLKISFQVLYVFKYIQYNPNIPNYIIINTCICIKKEKKKHIKQNNNNLKKKNFENVKPYNQPFKLNQLYSKKLSNWKLN